MANFSIPQYGMNNLNQQMSGSWSMPAAPWTPTDMNWGGAAPTMPGFPQAPVMDPNLVGFDPSNPATYGGDKGAGSGWGWNPASFKVGLSGVGTGLNLWNAFQANKIAKQQLAWSKEFGNANLNNSIKDYNTQLEDRAKSRASSMGWTPEQIAAYTEKNKVSR